MAPPFDRDSYQLSAVSFSAGVAGTPGACAADFVVYL
jgi:hypothetical protein